MKRGLFVILFVSLFLISSCIYEDISPIQESPLYDYDCYVDSVYVSGTENGATCAGGVCELGDSVYYEVHYYGDECGALDGMHVVIRNDYEIPPDESYEMPWDYACQLTEYPFGGTVGGGAIFYDDDITGTEGTLSGLFEIDFRWFDDEIDWRCDGMNVGHPGGDVMVYAFMWKAGEEGYISTIEQERIFEDYDVDYGFKFGDNPNYPCEGSLRQALIKDEMWGSACNWDNENFPDWYYEGQEDPAITDPCYIFFEDETETCCPSDRYCTYLDECYPDVRNDVAQGVGVAEFNAIDLGQHITTWDYKNYAFCLAPWMVSEYHNGGKWMDCDSSLGDVVYDLHGHEDVPAYQCDTVLTTVNNNDFYVGYGYGQQIDVEENSLFYTGDRNACYLENQIEAAPSGEPLVGEYTQVGSVECCGDDLNEYLISSGGVTICCDSPDDYVNAQGLCSDYTEETASCPDGTCNSDENCVTCTEDCGPCPSDCGDEICELDETCENCPGDCGICDGESGSGEVPETCGDGIVNHDDEDCDGDDLDRRTCQSLGYTYGKLICKDDCTYDLSVCSNGQTNPVQQEDPVDEPEEDPVDEPEEETGEIIVTEEHTERPPNANLFFWIGVVVLFVILIVSIIIKASHRNKVN